MCVRKVNAAGRCIMYDDYGNQKQMQSVYAAAYNHKTGVIGLHDKYVKEYTADGQMCIDYYDINGLCKIRYYVDKDIDFESDNFEEELKGCNYTKY